MRLRVEIKGSIGALRLFLATLHLTVAITSVLRPHMTEVIVGYKRFHEIAPTPYWGGTAFLIALGLLALPRGSLALIAWQFLSASFFLLFGVLVTGQVGLNWGTGVYGTLSFLSFVVMYVTAIVWFERQAWHRRLAEGLRPRGEHADE
ncbi:hypothetical protein [Deinococcus yavapaiensis]|uniref:Uncharacterized protein n=1 Tax=Deinococcus yavapaiensis KR-236 TaxID=694435 RepID=A0A318SE81_9DEIO|nr:hypothetical protein [Deinococcus yavapaiensis]PYE51058.1 hypothetical protein DES52_116125 [Deinococcus yavapaiensis KR-236]